MALDMVHVPFAVESLWRGFPHATRVFAAIITFCYDSPFAQEMNTRPRGAGSQSPVRADWQASLDGASLPCVAQTMRASHPEACQLATGNCAVETNSSSRLDELSLSSVGLRE